ncbi:MAG: hypothetical protein ACXAD7_03795 [Candidatus Kariarchaeaceae archaeon]
MQLPDISWNLSNGLILLVPIIIWNIQLTSKLRLNRYFQENAPQLILIIENFFRGIVFIGPLFLTIKISENANFNIGLLLYITGTLMYFTSWIVIIKLDSQSIIELKSIVRYIVLFAPAYTPLLIFIGIAFMCSFVWYVLPVVIFLILHLVEYIINLKV